jgi:succinate-acetate transporter protein
VIGIAILLTLVVGAIAALHAYWGLGGLWPAANEATLARAVIGDGRTRMPPPSQCFAVALLLAAVAAWPWLVVTMPTNRTVMVVLMIIVAIFFLRALAAFSSRWRSHFPDQPFATNDRRFYGPLCFTLSAGYAAMMEGMKV